MSDIGFIKIHRSIRDNWIWEEPQKLKWWLDIIMLANYKDKKMLLGNEFKQIERGSFHTSESKLASRWEVSRKTVSSFLSLLEKDEMIKLNKSRYGTTVKVLNYNEYQDFFEEKRTVTYTEELAEEEQEKNGKGSTTNKGKKDKKEKNKESSRFTPPTVEEVKQYCEERKNGIDPNRFVDYYTSNGWMRGKTKIKDWKACVRTWENKNRQSNTVKGYSNEEEPDPF